jgi:serine/threonine protein kinase
MAKPIFPDLRIDPDGRAVIGKIVIAVPNVAIRELIGVGANGIVFRAAHKYLDRDLAVKVWLTLRDGDRRDKFSQGIAEARKAASVDGARRVLHIYDAGAIGKICYAIMDYFPGVTLREWLNDYSPSLDLRALIASMLLSETELLSWDDCFHGDLHTNNILIGKDYAKLASKYPRKIYSRVPDAKLIDFGTSYFTSTEYSIRRHWSVFNETFVRLLSPLDINKLWGATKPTSMDSDEICAWYHSFLAEIEPMLISIGADWLINPEIDRFNPATWPNPDNMRVPPYKDKAVAAELGTLVRKDVLVVDKFVLGCWGNDTGHCGSR